MRSFYTNFDIKNHRIGFARSCAEVLPVSPKHIYSVPVPCGPQRGADAHSYEGALSAITCTGKSQGIGAA
eukprot:10325797-Alexandrium_andersonii.AAC.1